ncbi:hypothetical protein PtB15_3B281 [Puccinia triticina]|nr:hypothetical protein PtB15_3B281 [Puccinia triticina]
MPGKCLANAWQCLANAWQCLANAWQCLANAWQCLANAWQMPGNAWQMPYKCLAMPGKCLANAWQMPGKCLANAWQMPGKCLAMPGKCQAMPGISQSQCDPAIQTVRAVTLSTSSCYFTVAGILLFKFKLDKIPQSKKIIKIYKIVCLIKQNHWLISIKDKDSRTSKPAQSWPPSQCQKVFVLDHSNVPEINHTPDCTTSASNMGASNAPSRTTSSHRPAGTVQQTSPLQSRSRSRIQGLLIGPGRSGEHPSGKYSNQSRHGNHSWNGLTSIRLGRRRKQPAPSEPPPAAQEPQLYLSHSANRLGKPSPANHQSSPTTNPGTPPA